MKNAQTPRSPVVALRFFLRENRIDAEKAEDGQDEKASEAFEAVEPEGAKEVA
jgi:hypothetical protein